MTEQAVQEVEDTNEVAAEGGEVEAQVNLNNGIEAKVDINEPEKKEDPNDPIERVKEKYGGDVDEIAKALTHAQKKISEGQYDAPEAPEEYKYSFDVEGLEEGMIADDDPLLERMSNTFKENNIPQDVADKLVNSFLEYELEMAGDPKEEMAKLGKDKDVILERLTNFSEKNLEEGERETFDSFTSTAAGVKVLQKMVDMMGEQKVADTKNTLTETKSAQEYIDEAFAYREKHSDTIAFNRAQQEHYEGLIAKSNSAKK